MTSDLRNSKLKLSLQCSKTLFLHNCPMHCHKTLHVHNQIKCTSQRNGSTKSNTYDLAVQRIKLKLNRTMHDVDEDALHEVKMHYFT